MRLPGMDGTEVLRNIRQSSKTVPVIVLTAHSTIERAERCADLGVQGYIRKPYDCDDLLDRVREILRENEDGEDNKTNQTQSSFAELSNPVQECLRFIDSHCTEPIRPKDVAAEVCPKVLLSKNYLGKMFKKEMGCSIDEHINRLRIQKSKEILVKDGDVKVLQLYEQLGFKDESVFLRYFKKYENMTPTDYRRSNTNLAFRSAVR